VHGAASSPVSVIISDTSRVDGRGTFTLSYCHARRYADAGCITDSSVSVKEYSGTCFEVLIAATEKVVCWDLGPCSLVSYRRRGASTFCCDVRDSTGLFIIR
jgi:hypothetical protein